MNPGDASRGSQDRAAAAIRQIRAEIERSVPAERIEAEASIERSLQVLRQRASINAHWGIVPTWPVLGRIEVLGKRVLRILLRWYINPIVEQQNQFNLAVIAAIHDIEAQVHALSSDIAPDRGEIERDSAS